MQILDQTLETLLPQVVLILHDTKLRFANWLSNQLEESSQGFLI